MNMNEGSSSPFSSYDKAKHIVEVDEKIVAVFIVNPDGNISDLFIAEDAKIDNSMVKSIKSSLNIKIEKSKEQRANPSSLGEHLWDISESISTNISLEIKALTSTIVVAGRIS